MPVAWDVQQETTHPVRIAVVTHDRQGLLANVSAAIAACNGNISRATARPQDKKAYLDFTVDIRDVRHLREITQRVEAYEGVVRRTGKKYPSWQVASVTSTLRTLSGSARAYTAGTNANALCPTRRLDPSPLQVWIPAPLGDVVRVADVVAVSGPFPQISQRLAIIASSTRQARRRLSCAESGFALHSHGVSI